MEKKSFMNGKSCILEVEDETTTRERNVDSHRKEQVEQEEQALPEALIASFNNAMNDGRVRIGLGDSDDLTDVDPNSIVMCVIPYIPFAAEPLKHLNMLLMEAFCREHSVRCVKVTSMDGFCSLLRLAQQVAVTTTRDEPSEAEHYNVSPMDLSDLIIIEAKNGMCPEDEILKAVYDYRTGGRLVNPPVLPPVFPTFFEV